MERRGARRNGEGLEEMERDLKERKGTKWNGGKPVISKTEGDQIERRGTS